VMTEFDNDLFGGLHNALKPTSRGERPNCSRWLRLAGPAQDVASQKDI
jgi:hypothetical protein